MGKIFKFIAGCVVGGLTVIVLLPFMLNRTAVKQQIPDAESRTLGSLTIASQPSKEKRNANHNGNAMQKHDDALPSMAAEEYANVDNISKEYSSTEFLQSKPSNNRREAQRFTTESVDQQAQAEGTTSTVSQGIPSLLPNATPIPIPRFLHPDILSSKRNSNKGNYSMAKSHRYLENEVRDKVWAYHIESSFTNFILGNKIFNENFDSAFIECRRRMCEYQLYSTYPSRENTSNHKAHLARNWRTIRRELKKQPWFQGMRVSGNVLRLLSESFGDGSTRFTAVVIYEKSTADPGN